MRLQDWITKDAFKGKTVFVTGGGSGINLGIARSFAGLGANVAICGRSTERLAEAADQLRLLGAKVSSTPADVRNYEAVSFALNKSSDELGPADVLVCGAAGNFLAPADELTSNGFRTVVDIDLIGTFNAARAAFDQLKRTRGCLIFISGGQAYLPFLMQAHVGAAKAGVESLMRNLALEWGPHGIRCNTIVPGPVDGTEGMRRLTAPTGLETWTHMVPLGRFAHIDEIAAIAVVLASPLASYVTGAQIVVDGGLGLSGSGLFNQRVETSYKGIGSPDRPVLARES